MDLRYVVGEEWIGYIWCDRLSGDGEVDEMVLRIIVRILLGE